jgi:hypothetical protein
VATTYQLFTPGGSDPLTIGPFTDGTLIHSVWAPTPTNLFKILVPNPSGPGYVLLYQLQELSGEIISFGNNGYTSIQIQSDGLGGTPFYVAATDQIWQPFKEGPVLSVPPTIDMSAIGFYNYQHYGAVPGGTTTQNMNAFASMFTVMGTLNGGNGGGYGFFPVGSFPVNAGLISAIPNQSVLQGAGCAPNNGSGTCQFSIQNAGTFWNFTGTHTAGGVSVRNLAFGFIGAAQTSASLAVNANQENIKLAECVFEDCPQAVILNALSCSMEDCTVTYNGINGGAGPTGALAQVTLSAPEVRVTGREILQKSASSAGGPSGIAAISIGGQPCEKAVISDVHLSYHDYGITYVLANGAGYKSTVRSVEINAAVTGIYMVPKANNFEIYGERYTNCSVQQVNSPASNTPGIYIDTNGGPNANVDDIEFSGLECYAWLGSDGVQVHQGQNIRFKGGTISNNGSASAGVALIGPCGNVDLEGVNMQPSYANASLVQSQLYALRLASFAGIVGTIRVRGCDWSAYSGAPLSVGGSAFGVGGKLLINLTTGYNDQNHIVASSIPSVSTTTAASLNYFGPTVVDITAGAGTMVVAINSVSYTLAANETWSRPVGPYETFYQVSGTAPAVFGWHGIWG